MLLSSRRLLSILSRPSSSLSSLSLPASSLSSSALSPSPASTEAKASENEVKLGDDKKGKKGLFALPMLWPAPGAIPDHVFFPNEVAEFYLSDAVSLRMIDRILQLREPRFGYAHSIASGEVGTVAYLRDHSMNHDGSSRIVIVGGPRFKIEGAVKIHSKGYYSASVKIFDDVPLPESKTTSVVNVAQQSMIGDYDVNETHAAWLVRQIHRILDKSIKTRPDNVLRDLREDRPDIYNDPKQLSMWLSVLIPETSQVKKELLKTTSTEKRLQMLLNILSKHFRV